MMSPIAAAGPTIRADETRHERALKAAISVHCPNQDDMQMASRVDLATMRDQATVALQRCCDEASGLLSEVVRLATPAVYAPWPASRLLRLRLALWMTMEAARHVERISRSE